MKRGCIPFNSVRQLGLDPLGLHLFGLRELNRQHQREVIVIRQWTRHSSHFQSKPREKTATYAIQSCAKTVPTFQFNHQVNVQSGRVAACIHSTNSVLFPKTNLSDPNDSSATEQKLDDQNSQSSVNTKPLTQRQRLAKVFAEYGTTAVVFHTTISLTSLGLCYLAVSSGIDMVALLQKIGIIKEAGLQSTVASGASTFVVAYACHKVFMPVRIFLTLTCTPIIVSKLRSIGLLKIPVQKKG